MSAISWTDVLALLEKRVGLLDGVVFSGGEPLLQSTLPDAIRTVQGLGFRIGLHTGGAVPSRFTEILPDLDWVGFDVKAPFDDYARITGSPESGVHAQECLLRLLASGIASEIRTTIHPSLLDGEALFRMTEQLSEMSIDRWILQSYRAVPNTVLKVEPYGKNVVARLQACGLQIVWR